MSLNPEDEVWIQKALQSSLSSFLVGNLPNKVNEFVLPHFRNPRAVEQLYDISQLSNFDLYVNLRIFIGNYKFFIDSQILSDNTLLSCARIILNWRNKVAHRTPQSEILESYEQTLFEIMAVNRFLSLLPFSTELKEEIGKLRQYSIKVTHKLAKNYLGSELHDEEKTIEIDKSSVVADTEIKTLELEQSDDEVVNNNTKITEAEALQLLKKVRDDISTTFPSVLKYRNLLRDSIINLYTEKKITSVDELQKNLSEPQFKKTDPIQFEYFEDIKQIIDKL